MIRSNYFQDNPDLQLSYNSLIDWKEIIEAYEQGFGDAKKYKETGDESLALAPNTVEEAKDYYTSVLDSLGELMGTMVSQKSQEMDHEGLKYSDGKVTFPKAQEECYEALRDAGLMPMAISRKYHGLGLPVVVQALGCDIAARADAASPPATARQRSAVAGPAECEPHAARQPACQQVLGAAFTTMVP